MPSESLPPLRGAPFVTRCIFRTAPRCRGCRSRPSVRAAGNWRAPQPTARAVSFFTPAREARFGCGGNGGRPSRRADDEGTRPRERCPGGAPPPQPPRPTVIWTAWGRRRWPASSEQLGRESRRLRLQDLLGGMATSWGGRVGLLLGARRKIEKNGSPSQNLRGRDQARREGACRRMAARMRATASRKSASPWWRVMEIRRRAVPSGTVGGRTAVT